MKPTAALVLLASAASCHMELVFPAPFLSKYNKFTDSGKIDYSMTSPLIPAGPGGASNFPCKGYHPLRGTPMGKPVATFERGRSYRWQLAGGVLHDGGSCQASLSYDGGATWTVIRSYVGGCPLKKEGDFVVPGDAPPGEAIFAWTWFNRVGNREMYMNCAAVTIGGNAGDGAAGDGNNGTSLGRRAVGDCADDAHAHEERGSGVAFASRPSMFVANVGNGCGTVENLDVVFPNPGSEVDAYWETAKQAAPTGSCQS